MIRIEKSTSIPEKLAKKGKEETERLKKAYDLDKTPFLQGKHSIDRDIYAHPSVKKQLQADQLGKCCYCESDFIANAFGDVEHFRPKKGFRQQKGEPLQRPGYYWLAYNWDNLFFSCQICNSRHKKNLFPITDENDRAHSHHDPLEPLEICLLIDPAKDDPERHISFHEEIPFGLDDKGRTSIAVYGLDRESLNELRRDHLEKLKRDRIIASLELTQLSSEAVEQIVEMIPMVESEQDLQGLIDETREFVANSFDNSAPYAAMIRANFQQPPK